jgi:hypothetical protein
MKYVEELRPGECFRLGELLFLITCDFKASGDRLCYCLSDGHPKWIKTTEIVNVDPIYTLNSDNAIVAVKNYDKQDINIS